jgi:hypothetical protein
MMDVGDDSNVSTTSLIPQGLCAYILEAAHGQQPDAMVLHHLLSSHLNHILARDE